MMEIYLLGLFVAYVRLSGMAQVDLGRRSTLWAA